MTRYLSVKIEHDDPQVENEAAKIVEEEIRTLDLASKVDVAETTAALGEKAFRKHPFRINVVETPIKDDGTRVIKVTYMDPLMGHWLDREFTADNLSEQYRAASKYISSIENQHRDKYDLEVKWSISSK